MCLLIYRPAGEVIPESFFDNADTNNPDGFGISAVKDGKIAIRKGLFKFKKIKKVLEEFDGLEALIHFRAASPGMEISANMCHPFFFDTPEFKNKEGKPKFQFTVGHNGKLVWRDTKTESDTYCFVEDVMSVMLGRDPWFLDGKIGQAMLGKFIGDTNKLVVMRLNTETGESNCYIINSDAGFSDRKAHFLGKVWFSNGSYKKSEKIVPYYGYGDYISGAMGGVAKTPSHPQTILSLQDINDKFSSPWKKPDDNGWVWDFRTDDWFNERTKVHCKHLTSRPQRPDYIVAMEKRAEEEQKSKAKSAEQSAKAFTDPDLADEEEWRRMTSPDEAEFDMVGDTALLHLEPFQRKILRMEAKRFFAGLDLGDSIGRADAGEMICWFRSDLRGVDESLYDLDDEELDKWIVESIAKGFDVCAKALGQLVEVKNK